MAAIAGTDMKAGIAMALLGAGIGAVGAKKDVLVGLGLGVYAGATLSVLAGLSTGGAIGITLACTAGGGVANWLCSDCNFAGPPRGEYGGY